ncbi:MAG TPA: hypothetical protein VGK82_15195 [Pyrinomonadaceae bacterium]
MKTLNSRTTFQAKIANTFADPAAIQSSLEAVLVPEQISKWLGRLRLLKGVPFNYLVPDERMLPPESIRFFYLDINWIDSLLDGAFSIGRNLTKTENAFSHNLDSAVTPKVKQQGRAGAASVRAEALGVEPPLASLQVVSGFLLRSTVVSAYRGIGANVYPLGGTPQDPTVTLLDILRFEPLGPNSDTLICLVDGDAYRVDIHEAPEHLHYGINKYVYNESTKAIVANKKVHTFTKQDSTVTISKETKELDLANSFRSGSPRVLKMNMLAEQIARLSNFTTIDSAEMGFEMTEGVGMVQFKKESSQS